MNVRFLLDDNSNDDEEDVEKEQADVQRQREPDLHGRLKDPYVRLLVCIRSKQGTKRKLEGVFQRAAAMKNEVQQPRRTITSTNLPSAALKCTLRKLEESFSSSLQNLRFGA
jgi:hypothetical protein